MGPTGQTYKTMESFASQRSAVIASLVRPWVLVFFFIPSIAARAEISQFTDYLRRLTTPQVFDLSHEGTLGRMHAEGEGTITQDVVDKYDALAYFYLHNDHRPLGVTTWPHILEREQWWILKKPFKDLLKKLYRDNRAGGSEIHTAEVLEAASRVLSERRNAGEFGAIYYGFRVMPHARNDRFLIFASPDLQTKIESVLSNRSSVHLDRVAEEQAALLRREAITAEELTELMAIKEATRLFLTNSPFADAPGGWANNEIHPRTSPHCGFVAYCGEHAETMLMFLRSLENQGLIRNFRVLSRINRNNYYDSHSAISIANKQTGRIYVVDSWIVKGGSPPMIVPFSQFSLWRTKRAIPDSCMSLSTM